MPNLRSIIKQSLRARADIVPADFKTAQRWAELEKLSLDHTRRLLRRLMNTKPHPLIEQKYFAIISPGGRLQKVAHYRYLR